MNRNNKYQYGYLPKINYWRARLNEAYANGNLEQAIRAEHKLEYFQNRQAEVYGTPKEWSISSQGLERVG